MSKYGVDYYNAAYYGSNTSVQFSAAPFVATPIDYGVIQLTWLTPTGSWSYIRLVRNAYGYPVTADDGDLLFEQANAGSSIIYFDRGQSPANAGLKQGKIYYYTLFVKETVHNTWQNAGVAEGIAVKDYGTTKNMYDYLPDVLKSNIPYDTTLEVTNDFLYRFLKLFSFQLDTYKTQAENVANRYDITNVDGTLIPVIMEQFGLTYEPYIGLKQSRIFLRNIAHLYQTKGTLAGLKDFIKAYAGYDNIIVAGKNLMLDQNDSSFEQSIGSWASVSNATLARHLATDSPTVVPYAESTAQSAFPNLQKATLQVTATASATTEISLSGDSAVHYGIPVMPATAYTFTAYTKAGSTGRAVSAQIYWYDVNGVALTPATAGSSSTSNTSTWTRVTSSVTSPTNAAYAVPHLKITSTAANEVHYFDALQFEQSASATAFQDARQIEITLKATRINEITNPNFESSTTGWSVTNGTFKLTTAETGEVVEANGSMSVSGGAVEVYASAAGTVKVETTNAMPIFASNDYTFSLYCMAEELVGDSKTVTPYISWYDASSNLLSTVTGTPVTTSNVFLRPYVTSTAPAASVTAKVGLTWTATAAGAEGTGNEVTIDAALFEKSSFVNSYFDGSNGVADITDLFWEGNSTNNARSHYYKNRFAIQSRLIAQIPSWIHYGSTFELLLAQPGT